MLYLLWLWCTVEMQKPPRLAPCSVQLDSRKTEYTVFCTPPAHTPPTLPPPRLLQRLVLKLRRTVIDPTSNGSGIDNWTLQNALLSWFTLKNLHSPSFGGCYSVQAPLKCLKRTLLTCFTSVLTPCQPLLFSKSTLHLICPCVNVSVSLKIPYYAHL